MTRTWPSREEWAEKAEYAVRTSCTPYERLQRLQPDTVWSTSAEDTEMKELADPAAVVMRRLLTTEIDRLRALLPERPDRTRPRAAWFVALEGQAYEDACNLGALEEMRTEIQRARRNRQWGSVAWHLGRIRASYPQIPLRAELVAADDRMTVISDAIKARHDEAADAALQVAISREVARRRTDEAWERELERRRDCDSPRVIRYSA